MSVACFGTNFIGIKGDCDGQTPTSGLYINDLTGVDLCTASMVANDEFETGVALLRNLEQTAIRLTCKHFFDKLSKYYNYSFMSSLRTVGRHYDDFEANTYLGEKGYEVEFISSDDLQEMFVDYVEVNVNANYTAIPYRIIDGVNITTGTTDLTAGVNRVRLEYTAKMRKIQIVFDISTISELPISSYGSYCGQCAGECSQHVSTCFTTRNIQKLNTETSFTYGGNAAAMTIAVQCRCSEDNLACKFKSKLETAIWYHMGALLMDEVIHSKLPNPLVRNLEDSARELYVKWMGGTNQFSGMDGEALYWKELSRVAKQSESAIASIPSKCLNCTKTKLVTSIP